MTLDEFLDSEIHRLARFAKYWRECNAIEPNTYPMSLPHGDWVEMVDMDLPPHPSEPLIDDWK